MTIRQTIDTFGISPAEFARRTEALLAAIRQHNLTGAVLFDSTNILYFTGFAFIPTERPIVFVLSAAGERALLVPRLEVEHAQAMASLDRVAHYLEYPGKSHPLQSLRQLLVEMAVLPETAAADTPQDAPRVGADQDGYPWIFGYEGPSLSQLTGLLVVNVQNLLHRMQAVKSPAEIALIRESCKWAHLAHRLLQQYTAVGRTETEVSLRASHEATLAMMAAIGPLYRAQSMWSSGPAAGYRGQIGRNAAIPHALANNITFQPGDVLVTGAGCPLWGYNSELERTMFVGEPSPRQRELFAHMLAAQETAFAAMRPGASCASVDTAVRAYYERHDLLPLWKHHTGHAIGLRYHEGPFLDTGDETRLLPGMVFTVEPGLYAPDAGGFRHSDTVVITDDGLELLTYYPRDWQSLVIPA
ncbi:MAG: aminopeptidase P family protein [Anaerolineales bacterium]|nr:aminopeptidase P family protein [Anaerolineales bacterium]